jgi:hypothetical protein
MSTLALTDENVEKVLDELRFSWRTMKTLSA